jgi:hypothetical protein
MEASRAPFQAHWWSWELPGARPCGSTYCAFPYEDLPPLDPALFQGRFGWLPPLSEEMRARMEVYRRSEAAAQLAGRLDGLRQEAGRLGLRLPEAFLYFMARPELGDQIPSNTACYFDLSDHIIQLPVDDGGFLIRFLNDQQEVLLWYLYLSPQSESCVVVSGVLFDDLTLTGLPAERIRANLHFCASGFEEFLYRYWIENQIWFAGESGASLTPAQTDYVRHYQA